MGSDKLVEMEGICKSFGNVRALDDVNLELAKGEIHAILGENGAGKTTLMNVLAGFVKRDSGVVRIRGKEVASQSPSAMMKLGVGMVHQHFSLIPTLTVYENFLLPNAEKNQGRKSLGYDEGRAKEMRDSAKLLGLEVDLDSRLSALSASERQKVEVSRLLYFGYDIVILDEPTSMLLPTEVEGLFQAMRRIASHGKGIIFLSHKLAEIKSVSDRVTVLRRGKEMGTLSTPEQSVEALVRLMLGENPLLMEKGAVPKESTPVLEVRNLVIRPVNGRGGVVFTPPVEGLVVRDREIVGMVGLAGSGQREIFDSVYGARAPHSGEIVFLGKEISKVKERDRIRAGIGYVPEDRQKVGLVPDLSVRDNLLLKDFGRFTHGFSLDGAEMDRVARELVERFDIRCESIFTEAKTLSGGNMQKTILAREIYRRPELLLAYEPTKGLDYGATVFVRNELLKYSEEGSVLLYSEDVEEVMNLSDRIYVICGGRLTGELQRSEFDMGTIGRLMTGAVAGAA